MPTSRALRIPLLLSALVAVAGCSATSAPKATFSTPISSQSQVRTDDKVVVQVSSAADVPLTDTENSRLRALIEQKIAQRKAQNQADGRTSEYEIEVRVTEYDKGNAFARAMLAGLGQIHVNGSVEMYELPERRLVGKFDVEKTFAWGGLYGMTTSIDDVEIGFADGVAAAVTGEPD